MRSTYTLLYPHFNEHQLYELIPVLAETTFQTYRWIVSMIRHSSTDKSRGDGYVVPLESKLNVSWIKYANISNINHLKLMTIT